MAAERENGGGSRALRFQLGAVLMLAVWEKGGGEVVMGSL
jgi:hypothetical protein